MHCDRRHSKFTGLSATLGRPTDLSTLFGYVLAPIAWIIGVPWQDATVVGGLIVGLVTETLPYYVDAIGGEFQLMPAFVLILVVLLVRPQGLFGRKEVIRV